MVKLSVTIAHDSVCIGGLLIDGGVQSNLCDASEVDIGDYAQLLPCYIIASPIRFDNPVTRLEGLPATPIRLSIMHCW